MFRTVGLLRSSTRLRFSGSTPELGQSRRPTRDSRRPASVDVPWRPAGRAHTRYPDRYARVAATQSRQPRLRVPWAPYPIFAALVIGSVALEFVAHARCHQCINDWAMAGRVNVHSVKRRWVLLGPWQWRASGRS